MASGEDGGDDWPQRMAVWKPAGCVESTPRITRQEAELILCDNPARLMGLDSGLGTA